MKKLILIGASGHGKVCADIAKLNGYEDIVFADDDRSIGECNGYRVAGIGTDVENMDGDVFVSIGNAVHRKRFCEMYQDRLVTLIHPDAVIAEDVAINAGTVVMAGAVINPASEVGRGCIINTSSSIDHDCFIGDYSHIAVGAHISGTVTIGGECWVGAGATVSNNVNICSGCIVGAGAVVIKDIDVVGTYAGVPARRIKNG